MLTKKGMKKLLTSVASEDDDKPTKNEVEVFEKSKIYKNYRYEDFVVIT